MTAAKAMGFTPTTELTSASPNMLFTYFLFYRWGLIMDMISCPPPNFDIDAATGILLSTCTNKAKRKEFQEDYLRQKKELGSATSAAIYVSGDFFEYVAEACEFVEKSYGGSA
jgi:hypothetical protein